MVVPVPEKYDRDVVPVPVMRGPTAVQEYSHDHQVLLLLHQIDRSYRPRPEN